LIVGTLAFLLGSEQVSVIALVLAAVGYELVLARWSHD
jgi:hypothetical protein